MPCENTTTIINSDSKIRTDVESTARILLCEIDYILSTLNCINDVRHQTFLIESAITKTASVFQLAMRSCDYLNNKDFKNEIIERTKKGSKSSLDKIRLLRDNNYHDGYSTLKSERFYPFAKIKGRGYVGIYIHRGASLYISNYQLFFSNDFDYAITSDGIYQIENAGTNNEEWKLIKTSFEAISTDIKSVVDIIIDAASDLKLIWKELREIRKKGDGTHEYSYLNEGGTMELYSKENEQITSLKLTGSIQIKGNLTLTPPDGIKVEPGRLTLFIESE